MLTVASLANALGMQFSSSTGQSSNLGAAAQNLLMVWLMVCHYCIVLSVENLSFI